MEVRSQEIEKVIRALTGPYISRDAFLKDLKLAFADKL